MYNIRLQATTQALIVVTIRWNKSHFYWIFSKFLTFTLHTFVLTQMLPSPSPMLGHAYFGALRWLQYSNQHWGRGKLHKCFKICDEYCRSCEIWHWFPCGADGRSGVRSHDHQIFLAMGLRSHALRVRDGPLVRWWGEGGETKKIFKQGKMSEKKFMQRTGLLFHQNDSLCVENFYCAVSGFCQVFILTRAKSVFFFSRGFAARGFGLWPTPKIPARVDKPLVPRVPE